MSDSGPGKKALGGKRAGAGRPSLKDSEDIKIALDYKIKPNKVIEALAKQVEKGNLTAIKLWLGYRYGAPAAVADPGNKKLEAPNIQINVIGKSEDKKEIENTIDIKTDE